MTPVAPRGWTRRKWAGGLVTLVAFQVALLFWLGAPPPGSSSAGDAGIRMQMTTDPGLHRRLAELPWLPDPTLFALPHLRGFSGAAWLSYTSNMATDRWSASPDWLPLPVQELGSAFTEFLATNQPQPLRVLRSTPGVPAIAALFIQDLPMPTQTVVKVEGPWRTVGSLPPPIPTHPDVLPPTTVDVLVGLEGRPESAVVVAESGNRAVDQLALDWITNLSFQPASAPTVSSREAGWARLTFYWYVSPPPVTNRVAAVP